MGIVNLHFWGVKGSQVCFPTLVSECSVGNANCVFTSQAFLLCYTWRWDAFRLNLYINLYIATLSSPSLILERNPIYLQLKTPPCLSLAMSLQCPSFHVNPTFILEEKFLVCVGSKLARWLGLCSTFSPGFPSFHCYAQRLLAWPRLKAPASCLSSGAKLICFSFPGNFQDFSHSFIIHFNSVFSICLFHLVFPAWDLLGCLNAWMNFVLVRLYQLDISNS